MPFVPEQLHKENEGIRGTIYSYVANGIKLYIEWTKMELNTVFITELTPMFDVDGERDISERYTPIRP